MTDLILVLNCGSSSIKSALFDAGRSPLPREALWKGQVDGVATASARFEETGADPQPLTLGEGDPFEAALVHLRERVTAVVGERRLVAVAHRVVHGGTKYLAPVVVDDAVLADLTSYIPLAPLHQPFALDAIKAWRGAHPELPQIACFDTAFHRTMPEVERMLALPYADWERGVRRYGFHGLSYEFVGTALAERHGDVARGRVIVAHLGSGASLCAMSGLESVATTMGFSALDGLMMGTRCGSLDPGALLYLMSEDRLSVEQATDLLYHRSGLLGVSGVSGDPRELLKQEEQGNPQVRASLALYVRRIVREIGALTAVLGGLDLLAFTAGIGEHNAVVRERVGAGLSFVGIALDAAANQRADPVISAAESRVLVAVEPTNEEWVAARHAAEVLSQRPQQ